MYELRPYQINAIQQIQDSFDAGLNKVLVVSPTGSGKSLLLSFIIKQFVDAGKRVLFAVHRRTLVYDIAERVRRTGVEPCVVLPKQPYDVNASCFVASIQSLSARSRRDWNVPEPDLIIIDEAHRIARTGDYKDLFSRYPNAKLIGFTATPIRKDGSGLAWVFQKLIQALTYTEAFEDGYLVRAKYFVPSEPDLSKINIVNGDYAPDELDVVMNQPKLIGDLVEHYIKHAMGKRAIAFGVKITHSLAICQAFNAAGIPARHMDAMTSDEERDEIFKEYRAGETLVICNVGVLSEGVDVPWAEVMIDGQPTKSLGLEMQKIGRFLRPSPETGKKIAIILDHAANFSEHGYIEEHPEWVLEEGKKKKKKEAKPKVKIKKDKEMICENCYTIFISQRSCPACNHMVDFRRFPEAIDTEDGDLIEAGVDSPFERKPKEMMDPAKEEQYYAELLAWCRNMDFVKNPDGYSSRIFLARWGRYPNWDMQKRVQRKERLPIPTTMVTVHAQNYYESSKKGKPKKKKV